MCWQLGCLAEAVGDIMGCGDAETLSETKVEGQVTLAHFLSVHSIKLVIHGHGEDILPQTHAPYTHKHTHLVKPMHRTNTHKTHILPQTHTPYRHKHTQNTRIWLNPATLHTHKHTENTRIWLKPHTNKQKTQTFIWFSGH